MLTMVLTCRILLFTLTQYCINNICIQCVLLNELLFIPIFEVVCQFRMITADGLFTGEIEGADSLADGAVIEV